MVQKSTPPAADAILAATLRVVIERGLDRVTVREVAAAAAVAIGTVQHHFPTKDDLVTAAFTAVVTAIRRRVADVALTDDVRDDLGRVLEELLPMDARRRDEVRLQLAFAARAAVSPTLAALQRDVLDDVRAAVAAALARHGGVFVDDHRRRAAAAAILAVADGVAQHAVSSGRDGSDDPATFVAPVYVVLDALLA